MSAAAPTPSPELEPPSRRMVVFGIGLATLLGVTIIALLLYRGITTREPNQGVVIRGNAQWEEADLTVTGGELREPMTTKLYPLGNYAVPFYLQPGNYTLSVLWDGAEHFRQDFQLQGNQWAEITLPAINPAGPATRASTRPAD